MQCIEECLRVLKPGGVAIFTYISRSASLVDGYKYQFINDPLFQRIVEIDLLTGNHENPESNPNYFTTAFSYPVINYAGASANRFSGYQTVRCRGFASIIDTDEILQVRGQKALC